MSGKVGRFHLSDAINLFTQIVVGAIPYGMAFALGNIVVNTFMAPWLSVGALSFGRGFLWMSIFWDDNEQSTETVLPSTESVETDKSDSENTVVNDSD